jgi:purine-binding chemotaxis protein CheW
MARKTQRSAARPADMPHAQAVAAPVGVDEGDEQFIVFQIGDSSFALPLDRVGEITRLPSLARMPLAPPSLLGLANLRGNVLPVVDVRRLLGLGEAVLTETTRVVVLDQGEPVGFVVDRIEGLRAVTTARVEQDDAGAGSFDPDLLDGVIKGAEGDGTIKILNPQRLLRDEFAMLRSSGPRAASAVSIANAPVRSAPESQQVSLVTFALGAQEYALPVDRVREIIPLPSQVSEVARSETAVLGVVTLRDRLLPLVSLRALLGLPNGGDQGGRSKVLVLSVGKNWIGVVADRTRDIVRVDPVMIDPAPPLLTRGAGDAEITSICRLDQGLRLVAVLSPDRLFRSELVRRILDEQDQTGAEPADQIDGDAMHDEQFVIFRLGGQDYGLPIAAVDEIANPPEHITRVPRAPAFIDGVMNLRGIVVPIVDLRRRFELTSREPAAAPRILVLAVGGVKTGFMVDSVSEVMKVQAEAIRPAPEMSAEQMRLIGRVVNLDAQGRLILLIDPTQLLNRVEADVLANLRQEDPEQASKAS